MKVPGCEEVLLNEEITGFRQQSQDVQKGDLFFALKGKKVDGHQFLREAKERGAVAAVVSKDYHGEHFGLFLFHSEDVLNSLQALASQTQKNAKIIGVTGSVGKTTTKEFLAKILAKGEGQKVEKSLGSQNSQITLPLNFLNASSDAKYLILEMGMSQRGEISQLVRISPPDIAVITKIALAHAENFEEEGLLGIAKAKLEIFSHEKTKQAIVPHELLELFPTLSIPGKLSFSLENREADFYFCPSLHGEVLVDEQGVRAAQFFFPFPERQFLESFMAAASVARALKMSWDQIISSIETLTLPKMRFEKMFKNEVFWINDAYNANPTSMQMALKNLPSPEKGGKKIAVLGEMKELGKFSKSAHEEVGFCALTTVDHLLCLGQECAVMCELFQKAKKPADLFLEKTELSKRLKEIIQPGDVVLVKGSRSLQMEKIFQDF